MISDIIKSTIKEKGIPIYIGRFCPMHNGHEALIKGVRDASPRNHIVFIGSCNQPISYRNIFTFEDRLDFIRKVFGEQLTVAGLPDFKGDNRSWFLSLDQLVRLAGHDPSDVVFVGGCAEDVQWFEENNRSTVIVNRFDGITQNISGTEIRDCLITGNSHKLNKLINPEIVPLVLERFEKRWGEFKKT